MVKQNPGTINLEMYAGDSKALSKILEMNYQNKYKCSGVFTSDFTKKVYKAFCTTESGIQSVGYPVMIGCNGYEIRAD